MADEFPPGGIADQILHNGGFPRPALSGDATTTQQPTPQQAYHDYINNINNSGTLPSTTSSVSPVNPNQIDTSGKYPQQVVGANNEDLYAQGQTVLSKLGNAAVNLVAKTAAYTLQNAGFIVGAPAALLSGNISNLTDNFLVRAGDAVKEGVQTDFPIYKTEAYNNSSIWQKLLSPSWWLDDAVDRVALTAAMLIPGFAETRGLGLAGTLMDEAGNLKATGVLTKGLQAAAEHPESYPGVVNTAAGIQEMAGRIKNFFTGSDYTSLGKSFVPKLTEAAAGEGVFDAAPALKTYASSLTKAELQGWNIIGQSGLNAKEAQEGITKSLKEQRDQGKIALSDDEIDEKAKEGALKGFWWTMPLSFVGSLIELPQMMASARNAKSTLDKLFNATTGEEIENALVQKSPLWKTVLKAAGTGLEHGQNESMQVAIGRYLEENIAGKKDAATGEWKKDMRPTGQGVFEDFLDNIHDPNGQNNIALGTIQGVLMTVGGKLLDRYRGTSAQEKAHEQSLFNLVQESRLNRRYFTSNITDLLDYENGKPKVDGKGNAQFDQQKLADAGLALKGAQEILQEKANAIVQGNAYAVSLIDHDNLRNFSYPFFSDPSGMKHLESLLKLEYKEATKDEHRQNDLDELGNEVTPEMRLSQSLQTIQQLKKAYDAIDQRHAGFMDMPVDKAEDKKVAQSFLQHLKGAQYDAAADQQYFSQKLQKTNTALNALSLKLGNIDEVPIEHPANPDEEDYNTLLTNRDGMSLALTVSKEKYRTLTNRDAQRKDFKEKWLPQYNKVKENASKPAVVNDPSGPKKTLKVKTLDGEEDLEVGTPYYAGAKVLHTADGHSYKKFSKFTILGETEDGKLQVDTPQGKMMISRDALSQYHLGKVEDTHKYWKAQFYIHNSDRLYNFKKKNGEEITGGQLEYDGKNDILYYSYEKNGKTARIPVEDRSQFLPQKGFKTAQIYSTDQMDGTSLDILENQKLQQKQDQKAAARYQMIKELVNSSQERLSKVRKSLGEKRTALRDIETQLEKLFPQSEQRTPKGNLRKVARTALKAIHQLSGVKTALREEITSLDQEREELENTLPYYEDLLQHFRELPEDLYDVVSDLKQDISHLEELISHSREAITSGEDLISRIDSALQTAYGVLKNYIQALKQAHPGLALSVEGYQEQLEKYLGEQGARQFIENQEGFTTTVRSLQAEIADFEDELEIPATEKKIQQLQENLQSLQKGLEGFLKEQQAQQHILDYFEGKIKEFRDEQAHLKRLEQDKALHDKLFKAQDKAGAEPAASDVSQAIQKDIRERGVQRPLDTLFTGTVSPSRETEQDFEHKPHFLREEQLKELMGGGTLPLSDLRAVVVHQGNQSQLGLPGLVEKVSGLTENLMDPERGVILYLYIRKNEDGSYSYIDEKGASVGRMGEAVDLDKIVTSFAPATSLSQKTYHTREGMAAPEVYQAAWKKQRTAWLSKKDGFQVLELKNVSPGVALEDAAQQNPITESLITPDTLDQKQVVFVSTTEEVAADQFGSGRSIAMGLGKVYYQNGSTTAFLNSRHLTPEEATAVYQVLHQLAAQWKKTGTLDKTLTGWLQSVIYWYAPSEKNSKVHPHQVYIRDGKIHFGPNDTAVYFTPEELDKNRALLETYLRGNEAGAGTYHHVSSRALNRFGSEGGKYTEITGVDEKGVLQTREWPSYQHYLTSPTLPDGGTREAVPLTTHVEKRGTRPNIRGRYVVLSTNLGITPADNPPAPTEVKGMPPRKKQTLSLSLIQDEKTLATKTGGTEKVQNAKKETLEREKTGKTEQVKIQKQLSVLEQLLNCL